MLREGEIDAVISPTAPKCFADSTVPVGRLWPDYRAEEIDYWRRSAIFPIMHVLVIRRTLVEADPVLASSVIDAFEQARAFAAADLVTRDFPKLALPWLAHFAGEVRDRLGGDPFTYGRAANRTVLETMTRYAYADGLTSTLLPEAELFA